MMKRVFFSINPSDEDRDFIFRILSEKKDLFPLDVVRWVRKENIYITLLFIGLIKEDKMSNLFVAMKKAVEKIKSFTLVFDKICYHPQKGVPKLIWIKGEESSSISFLREELKKALVDEGLKFIEEDLLLHITLGRIKTWELKKMRREEIPQIEEELSFSLQVDSVFLMESILKKGSPDYNILNSVSL